MSTINYTYNVLVDRFRQFADGHFQLRRFTHGEISQADLEKEAEWPWLHVKPRAINYSPGTRSFSFEIFISDLPRDKEDKTGYQAESITDCSLIFQDLINEIYLGNMFGSDVVLTRPVNSEPFVEQYTHTLTGVTGTIELSLDYDWSACSIPASWNYNTPTDSGTDGWGALQFIESLDQNGVFVSLLNDVEAPGNSYYYGTNASGVKGWYAIVDNVGLTCETLPDCATIISIVDDIAALQTDKVDKVAGKGLSTEDYTTAEKSKLAGIEPGAEVNVNADWNAVSGDAQILNKPTIPSIAGLVPETRTLTINGTTQDLSANRTFTIATGLTVGTTPITSGTVGRVLFEGTGNVLQESANLFWDNTNSRLGIGTATPAYALDVATDIRSLRLYTNIIRDSNANAYINNTVTNAATTDISIGNATAASITLTSKSAGKFVFTTGNVLIGTTTDAGFKLDVNGTARVSGLTRSTDIFVVGGTATTNTANARFWSSGGQAPTSGLYRGFYTDISWIPSSGSAEWYGLDLRPTINQTGGANGITRGLYINPTLTAAADFRAIDSANGRVVIADTATVTGSNATSLLDLSQTWNTTGTPIAFKLNITDTASAALSDLISLQVGGSVRFRVLKSGFFTHNTGGEIAGNLVVGGSTIDASSQLEVRSTTRGFLPPRMTTTQKNAIASPAAGLVVYDTTLGKLCVRTAAAWETITSV